MQLVDRRFNRGRRIHPAGDRHMRGYAVEGAVVQLSVPVADAGERTSRSDSSGAR
jgi:hypothetical protein